MLKRTVKQPSDARGYDPPIFCGHSPVSDWSWSHNNSHKEPSEWITTLYTTYVDNLSRCELLEFAPGGDLLSRLIQTQTLPENTTRLLAAEILMAIRARHLTSYTYGNIRPENILIGRDGHIKLSSCGAFMSHDQLVRHPFPRLLLKASINEGIYSTPSYSLVSVPFKQIQPTHQLITGI